MSKDTEEDKAARAPCRKKAHSSALCERGLDEDPLGDEARTLELMNDTAAALLATHELPERLHILTTVAVRLSGAQYGAYVANTPTVGDARLDVNSSVGARVPFAQILERELAGQLFAAMWRTGTPVRSDAGAEGTRADSGFGSCLAVPVGARQGRPIGALFLVHSAPNPFDERTQRLVTGIAAQAAIAIENCALREALQREASERTRLLDAERAARAQAERMSEIKDNFLATLSHELRTPLNAILGWAQVLQVGPRRAADLDKGLESIERNARMQTQLIEDLLVMSRITSGKLRLQVRPLMPLGFLEAALETVQPAAEAKGIRIDRLLDPAAGPVYGDPSRLQQVVWNLLSNAIKFTPQGGRVRVLLENGSTHAAITVSDTGIGIPPQFLPHVFDRFCQADASTTRTYQGLGLGLSIVKHLVELHGGLVSAHSRGKGSGARFVVQLPLVVRPDVVGSASSRADVRRSDYTERLTDGDR